MSNWKEINQRIARCMRQSLDNAINCLKNLFEETKDGWVAFNLGIKYKEKGDFKNALIYFEKAKELLPLENYKNKAKNEIEDIKRRIGNYNENKPEDKNIEEIDISKLDPDNTLFIVSCTKTKIWDTNPSSADFVPARDAYTGTGFKKFLEWLKNNDVEQKGFCWVILSGKYGFIEPDHPIARYDVYLGEKSSGPISDETLVNQTKQKRWWRNNKNELIEVILEKFKHIICVNCNSTYYGKIKNCFPNATIESYKV